MARKLKALIVDDEPDLLRIGALTLERLAHWDVFCASTGDEGIAVAQREAPDVVLLDYMMPGFDGRETLARLKQDGATAGIPVIMMTARANDDDARACRDLGAAGVIAKPFDPAALPDEILRILEGV